MTFNGRGAAATSFPRTKISHWSTSEIFMRVKYWWNTFTEQMRSIFVVIYCARNIWRAGARRHISSPCCCL